MAGALSGSIEQMSLVNVLRFLSTSKNHGALDIVQAKESGKIYFVDGQIVHATLRLLAGEDALFEMLKWTTGNFEFNSGITPPQTTMDKPTDVLITEGAQKATEWIKIKEVIPSNRVVFRLSAKKSPGEVKLKAKEWSVLTQVNGVRTVAEIASTLRMDEFEVVQTLYNLFTTGLLEISSIVEEIPQEVVPPMFFNVLQAELTKLLGPVAMIIIDDILMEKKENKESFPKEKVANLVEAISEEISDNIKKLSFQQAMLNEIKKI